jgi:calcineurin-like phosphoesterase family protein
MRFFTADTHLGHRNMLSYCERPFATVEEMDAELIKRWNVLVKPDDEVYHVGDFAWREPEKYINLLQGRLHLITGNHDHKQTRKLSRWLSVQPYLEIKDKDAGLIVLCHYPLQVWNRSHFGTWHLHGHSHGTLPPGTGRRLDVGIDGKGAAYAPWSQDEIAVRVQDMPMRPVDHHHPPDYLL